MNSATAKSFYDSFTPEEKAQAKALKSQGLDPLTAIKQVHAAKVGDVARAAQPDLDAAESNPSTGEQVGAFAQGVGRAAGMGLDDEAAGVLHTVAPWNLLPAMFDDANKDKGVTDIIGGLYREGRDDQRDANAAIDRGTNAAQAGMTAFTVASPLLPGGKVAQSVKAFPSILNAVKEGGKAGLVAGAAQGFGKDEGPVLANTLIGAGEGGLIGAGAGLVGGLANPQARANAVQTMRDYGAATKARVKPLDVIGEIPIVGKPIKAAGQQFQGVAADVAAARAKRPMGGDPDILDPAISDDFVNPEVIDMASPSTPQGAPDALPTAAEMAQLPEGTRRWLGEGQKRLTAGEDLEGLTDAVSAQQVKAEPGPPPRPSAATEAPEYADEMANLVDAVQPPPAPTLKAEASDPLAAMMAERAQDWGTRPSTAAPMVAETVPDPDIFAYFMEQTGGDKQKSLAMTFGMMAKLNAGAPGAVGRQRSAAPFSGQKAAPIATPKGRNRSAAPFLK